MHKIDSRLQRIANVLLLNASFTDNLGLLNGKMGVAIFFYHYAKYSGNNIYEVYAGELIDEIYDEININTPMDFSNGLTGIGWGIGYLVDNRFVDADTEEALVDIDNAVYNSLINRSLLIDDDNNLFGYGFYFLSRFNGHGTDNNSLNTFRKKECLNYLTDECEKLLIQKLDTKFNISKLSITTFNSILWYLLEMERVGICHSKVRKILHYLPGNIMLSQENNSIANKSILLDLVQRVVLNIPDKSLQKQYWSILKCLNGYTIDSISDEKSLLSDLKMIHFQKLLYHPYIDSMESIAPLYQKVLEVINNEEVWNSELNGLNKANLGLKGLAGTGLLLLDYCPSGKSGLRKNICQEKQIVKDDQ